MSFGPTIIFDKSVIQALSAEEALCLEHHYRINIVPIFFVEVLADIGKQAEPNRNPEDIVRSIASKLSGMGSVPNVHHSTLCLGELLGHSVEQRGVPVLGGGKFFRAPDGNRGVFFDEPPEIEALRRWSGRDFLGVERDFAKVWRNALAGLDLGKIAAAIRPKGKSPLRTLSDVKTAADTIAEGVGKRYKVLKLALSMLGIPLNNHAAIVARWKAC